jgi:MoaA/NifB/PqqE/SkfB family radical SAM enzyme
MIKKLHFGLKLLSMYKKANFSQIKINPGDHNKPYLGTKIPLSMTFCCTHKCNLKCLHCSEWKSSIEENLNTKRFLSLLDEMAEAGTIKIGLSGGEPLIRNDIGEILNQCYKNKFIVHLTSNGWYVTKYIDRLKGLDLLILSLDGDKQTHDFIRGKGSFDKFIEAVDIAKKNNISVAAMITLNSLNHSVLKEAVDITSDKGMLLMVGTLNAFQSEQFEKVMPDEQARQAIKIILKKKNLVTSKKYFEFIQGKQKMSKCFAGIGHFLIGPNGMLYPCSIAYHDKSNYEGISILDKSLKEAIMKLPLYRQNCSTCRLICYYEINLLYQFDLSSIMQNMRLIKHKNRY